MSKINGITVGTPTPRSNFNQTDPKKADYIIGRDKIASVGYVDEKIGNIETALDGIIAEQESIIAIQEALIGGDGE